MGREPTKKRKTATSFVPNKNPTTNVTTLQSIPEELQRKIFAHVPPDDILNWGKICGQWLSYTKENSFWRLLWRQQGGAFAQLELPDRVFASKKAGQMLYTIYSKRLLTRNLVQDASLHWNLGPGVTYGDELGSSKPVCLLPPGSKITQDIILCKHGIYPTILKQLGPMQFVTSARFRFQPGFEGWGDIVMLGLSQIGHGRMARFERMSNIETDSDGWKTAQLKFETLGSTFKTARQNKLLLHIANMASSEMAIQVTDVSIVLKVISVETVPKKPEFGYGFKESMFRPMDSPEI